jgi:hypothetical protein
VKDGSGLYGCRYLLARHCGLSIAPWQGNLEPSGGNWQHGWHPPEHNVHPDAVVGYDGMSEKYRSSKHFFVARVDQVAYLKRCGYRNVRAIGLPILYVNGIRPDRVPNSLLIMPSHSTKETNHSWDFSNFIINLKSVLPNYAFVVACIHPACIEKGYWLEEFEELGVPIIEGASGGDRNALVRMANLFSIFTDVVGNGFGSHLVYAAYFGANPFLIPPWPVVKEDDYLADPLYRSNPEVVRALLAVTTEDMVKTHHPLLFRRDSVGKKSWANFQIGHESKLSPFEAKRVIGWGLMNRIKISFLARLKKHLSSGNH